MTDLEWHMPSKCKQEQGRDSSAADHSPSWLCHLLAGCYRWHLDIRRAVAPCLLLTCRARSMFVPGAATCSTEVKSVVAADRA